MALESAYRPFDTVVADKVNVEFFFEHLDPGSGVLWTFVVKTAQHPGTKEWHTAISIAYQDSPLAGGGRGSIVMPFSAFLSAYAALIPNFSLLLDPADLVEDATDTAQKTFESTTGNRMTASEQGALRLGASAMLRLLQENKQVGR